MNVGHSKTRSTDNMDNFQRFLSNDEIKMTSERTSASKKGILLQNLDEGKPCLKCGEKCPGFSLHVWRFEPERKASAFPSIMEILDPFPRENMIDIYIKADRQYACLL